MSTLGKFITMVNMNTMKDVTVLSNISNATVIRNAKMQPPTNNIYLTLQMGIFKLDIHK